MRMRKKKHGAERMEACGELWLRDPSAVRENLTELLNGRKLCVEIGCGKGTFVCESAKLHGDCFFVALEKVTDVVVVAMEKVKAAELSNVRFISGDVKQLSDFFPNGSIDEIYLNFSDPWPKKGHAKRRLTHRAFLEFYKSLLKPDGVIFFKTDNQGLFDFSLEEMTACNFSLSDISYDLHHSDFAPLNIMTEYERTFSARGFTINRVVAHLKSDATKDTKGLADGHSF